MIRRFLFFVFVFIFVQVNAQHTSLPLSHNANLIYEQKINASKIHSSFNPLIKSTINNCLLSDAVLEHHQATLRNSQLQTSRN